MTKGIVLIPIAIKILSAGMNWFSQARHESSPGGEDITGEEYVQLGAIIMQAVLEGLGIDLTDREKVNSIKTGMNSVTRMV